MNGIKRFFVRKKIGFHGEETRLLKDIHDDLSIFNLKEIAIYNRYDVEGLQEAQWKQLSFTVFAEPASDELIEDEIHWKEEDHVFAVEYLPGQYDQRADSAMQCAQVIVQSKECPVVAAAKVYILKGAITNEEFESIKKHCVNPVDSRLASLQIPKTLTDSYIPPSNISYLDGFRQWNRETLADIRLEMGLAMSLEDFKFCQTYFDQQEQRDPTVTEIKVIDTYWSDHCRHTTFQTQIQSVQFESGPFSDAFEKTYQCYLDTRREVYGEQQKNICFMDMATIAMKALKKRGILTQLDESDEINACSIEVEVEVDGKKEPWLILFKNETHNHPTEIEPFGGAATCLGGAIRDPLSGRAYVYQAMRITGAADPRRKLSDTLPGKLPQRKIVSDAARGYSSYGNQIGLATGQVQEFYDDGFLAKRMEIGAVIGAVKKENVLRQQPKAGDVILLLGGGTGRDGCGGATGSSKEHTLNSIKECGAEVQKGNPPTERKLQRLFRIPEVSKMIKRCNDFGAGGVSVAIGELADGLSIHLDLVPKKYEGLDGTELAISESQERMAVVIDKEDMESFVQFGKNENLEVTKVAEVTDSRRLVMYWRGKDIVNLSRDFLDTNGVTQTADAVVESPDTVGYFHKTSVFEQEIAENLERAWLHNMQELNHASQKGLAEQFDATIGASTIFMPFGGKFQQTPIEAMSAKIPLLQGETDTATCMAFGYEPEIAKWSPFHGGAYAVVESIAKLVATGCDNRNAKLTFQEYFERLNQEPRRWGKPLAALLGAFRSQMELSVAAIGGKDSMSGTFLDLTVPPTLVSFAVTVEKAQNLLSPEWKQIGSKIVFLPIRKDQYFLPDYEYLKKLFSFVHQLIHKKQCVAASTVKQGGIAETVSKMALGNGIGMKFESFAETSFLFQQDYGSFVLEIAPEAEIDFAGLDVVLLGKTIEEPVFLLEDIKISLDKIQMEWEIPLQAIFPTKTARRSDQCVEVPLWKNTHKKSSNIHVARPKVIIPVFPGTNCEYDSARAFEKAGAQVVTKVIANYNLTALQQSIQELAKEIANAQILMLPGGFSAGDEPDGSGKFIAAVFRNLYLKEAVEKLHDAHNGLILGICNGFQALLKLGLLPYGKIQDMDTHSPTLTYNAIGRHVSCFVQTKVISNLSPWLWKVEAGETFAIPVSHGEGRLMAETALLQKLGENGQIATQYVTSEGRATYDMPFNPNGSTWAIESISSPDGRILGKMGHSERIGKHVCQNILGQKDQQIFQAGVEYFQ